MVWGVGLILIFIRIEVFKKFHYSKRVYGLKFHHRSRVEEERCGKLPSVDVLTRTLRVVHGQFRKGECVEKRLSVHVLARTLRVFQGHVRRRVPD